MRNEYHRLPYLNTWFVVYVVVERDYGTCWLLVYVVIKRDIGHLRGGTLLYITSGSILLVKGFASIEP